MFGIEGSESGLIVGEPAQHMGEGVQYARNAAEGEARLNSYLFGDEIGISTCVSRRAALLSCRLQSRES